MRASHFIGLSLFTLVAGCAGDAGTAAPSIADDGSDAIATATSIRNAPRGRIGAVYVLSNDATANAVLIFPRDRDGQLGAPISVATGGQGTGRGLGNQGALAFGDEEDVLYAVDAGSNEISVLTVGEGRQRLLQRVPSGGDQPISIAVHDDLLYVLNDGTNANISGFRVRGNGQLVPLAGSTRARTSETGAVDGAQIAFSPDGRSLVVTEKAGNAVVSYPVRADGRTGAPIVTVSNNATPFGFEFTRRGTLIVSEAAGGAANASTVSSYVIGRNSTLASVSAAIPTTQSAACWIAVTQNGRFAYATNTGSNTVTGFAVTPQGQLTRLAEDGISASTGDGPLDLAFSRQDAFLYVRNGRGNSITIFEATNRGGLAEVGTVSDLPAGATGLLAR